MRMLVVGLLNRQLLRSPSFPRFLRIKGVALGFGIHMRDVLGVHHVPEERLLVDLASPNDEALCFAQRMRLVQGMIVGETPDAVIDDLPRAYAWAFAALMLALVVAGFTLTGDL